MTVSNTFKAAHYQQQTDEVNLIIVEIDHTDLDTPIRVVNNTENVTSGGDEYLAAGFNIKLPNDDGHTSIDVCNIDRVMVNAIRSISTRPTVSLSVILASDPNTVEVGPYVMELADVGYDAFTVYGKLSFDDFLDEPYGGDVFTPGQYIGLF